VRFLNALYMNSSVMFFIRKIVAAILQLRQFLFQGPSFIRINPSGTACNQRCIMCNIHNNSDDEAFILSLDQEKLDIDYYFSLIKNMPLSVFSIEIVGGGEPLLFKNIIRLFPVIRKKHIYGSLITNGSLLSKELSKTLVDCRWNSVRVSFNGASKETYYKIHQSDHFDLVLNNVKKLQQFRGTCTYPRIGMNYVLQKDNYREIVKFVVLANDLHLDSIRFDTLITCEPSKGLSLNEAEQKEAIALLLKAKSKANIIHNIDHTIHLISNLSNNLSRGEELKNQWCPIVQNQLEIRSNGMVIPCCMALEMANVNISIKKLSIKRIWNEYKTFRKDLKEGRFRSFCYDRCNYDLPIRRATSLR
jgi:MoaA/NifB/PqqE/SkfB family radical SAM enzyme